MISLGIAAAWLSTLLALLLGVYVVALDPTALSNRLFGLYAAALACWPAVYGLSGSPPGDTLAYGLALLTGGAMQISNVFFHFSLAFARRRDWLSRRWLMPLLYWASAAAWVALYAPTGFRSERSGLAGPLAPATPALVAVVVVMALVFVAALAVLLHHAARAPQPYQRTQAAWIAASGLLMLVYGLGTTVLPVWLAGVHLEAYSVMGVPMMAAIIAYAMSRHRLLIFDPGRVITAILESVPSGVLVANQAGTVQESNRTAERLTGAEAAALIDTPVTRWLPGLGGLPWDDPGGVRFHNRPAELSDAAGGAFPVSVTASPLRDRRRRITGTILFVDDERESERIRQQAMQSEQLATIGRLAGGVAHDFNNLLTTIMGYTELLEDRLGKSGQHVKEIGQITAAATRAATLTRQLLAFSRRQVLLLEPRDLNEIIRRAAPLLERALGQDARLRLELAGALPPASLDEAQTQQVLVVLAQNSRDAMPGGGVFTLATSALAVPPGEAGPGGLPPGTYAVLTATDTGPGVAAEAMQHIFQPFFTTKPRGQGTGMGLATVYGVVKQTGGHIEAENAPGAGARFRIFLPATLAAEPPAEPQANPPAARRKAARRGTETVLFVEDERSLRDAVSGMLENHGFRVLLATGGDDALAVSVAHHGRYDLLVTDVLMPGMDGPTLTERLRADRPDLKVLFVSGYTDKASLARELAKPGSAFLSKPFTGDLLAEEIRNLLDRP